MGKLRTHVVRVTTTGANGSASGTGETSGPIMGLLRGIAYDFHASAPATTDVTVRTKGGTPPSYTLHATTNTVTDVMVVPAAKPVDNANAAITDAHAPFPLADYVEVVVAQANALTNAVVVYLFVEEL